MTVAMWWVMMVAMMTPSATPLILLHSSVLRRQSSSAHGNSGLSLVLLLGYLLAWLAFAVVAASLQELLQPAGLLSEMMLWSRSAWFSAAVLAAAGTYQRIVRCLTATRASPRQPAVPFHRPAGEPCSKAEWHTARSADRRNPLSTHPPGRGGGDRG